MSNDQMERRAPSQGIVEKELSYAIGGCFFGVYNELGYGFVEPVYSRSLVVALQEQGLKVEREVPFSVLFHGVEVGRHRVDLLVERRIIVEIKSTERVTDVAKRQLRSYLKAVDLELGLLLHFGPRPEVHRVLNPRRANNRKTHPNRANEPNDPMDDSVNSNHSDA
jgi:GxxExxY protein